VVQLLDSLDKARESATADADELFRVELTEALLDALGEAHKLEKRSGNKFEQVEGYQVQFVFRKLQECRQTFARTKGRQKQLRKYLPWYRVLFACYRRIRYGLLNVYKE
jgi:hypothetical protein